MPPSPPNRNVLVERCSSLRGCEPCKRRKRVCNGQRPCGNCQETNQECVYSVVSDYSRSVFTTNSARRLSSGSACETCRRRKTKCDGGNPCAYCVNAGFECNNNSERRKRAQAHAQAQQQAAAAAAAAAGVTSGSQSTSSSTSLPGGGNNNNADDHQAMDRIEDRLRRIEKLMTAFTPSSPLSRSSFTASSSNSFEQQTVGTVASRKLSSPHPPPPSSSSSHTTTVRQHRHSVQGISVAKEQAALRSILKGTPPVSMTTTSTTNSSPPSSPPLSPSNKTSITSSMLNLSLSPSSSTSSNQSSNHNEGCLSPGGEWKQSTPIPSLMDQLSRRTFVPTAMDYMQFPIYPISSTPPPKSMISDQQEQKK